MILLFPLFLLDISILAFDEFNQLLLVLRSASDDQGIILFDDRITSRNDDFRVTEDACDVSGLWKLKTL